MRLPAAAALAALLVVEATACVYVQAPVAIPTRTVAKQGPPPHAPAHGYRHKHHHHGVELVFDSGLGLYVVVGRTGYYYDRDHYYRVVEGAWQVSVSLDSGWKATSHKRLPPGLAKKAARGKAKGRNHPAKHGH
jgi:hypothetical protein